MHKIQNFSINLQKTFKNIQSNVLVVNVSNVIFNKINIAKIINGKSSQYTLKDLTKSRTFKYSKTLDKIIFN